MKILFIHTYYQQKGGEDVVFVQEQELLTGIADRKELAFYNKGGLSGALSFFGSIWNIRIARKIRKLIKEYQPDVVHIYNLHFAIGPLAIRAIKKSHIPIVYTIPNYRLLCPSGTLQHNGAIFMDSVNRSFPWTAVRNKVYRNSYLQTFWLAFSNWFHRKTGTWKMVDKYILLTEMAKDIFLNSTFGVNPDQIVIKPNFIDPPAHQTAARRDHFLFVGRLTEEKGVPVLLKTFADLKLPLHIAGDGPLKNAVQEAAAKNEHITYLGPLAKTEVLLAMEKCTALIFPSTWFEGMPMTIIEAFSLGTPVIASNIGAMASMIIHKKNGLHFQPGNITSLTEQLLSWNTFTDTEKSNYGMEAKKSYSTLYTPEKNREMILNIYQSLFKQ